MTTHSPGKSPVVITRLTRVTPARPTVWKGETDDLREVHISYRHGWLIVEVREAVDGALRGWTWRKVLRCDTVALEALHETEPERRKGGAGVIWDSRVLAHRIAEGHAIQTAEIRRSLHGVRDRRARIVSFSDLRRWIELLGPSRVELRAWFETPAERCPLPIEQNTGPAPQTRWADPASAGVAGELALPCFRSLGTQTAALV